MKLLAELQRRNVLRAAVLYAGAVWALAQGIAQLGPAFGMPDWGTRWFVIAGMIGFPFWIAFAWFFEFTPDGIKREHEVEPHESITHHTGRKLDFAIIGVLAVAVVLLLTNAFVWHKGAGLSDGVNSAPIPEHSIAVLPFVNMSSDKEQAYFSDGISEELLNLLAKIPQLQVTARTSSFSFKGKEIAIQEIARTLHVANVLQGSVRKSGNSVRITAQLIKAGTGTHLWSQTYDRKFDDIFAIQDEIAAAVVDKLRISLLGVAPTTKPVDPRIYPLILQANALIAQHNAAGNERARALCEQAIALVPDEARAWDALAVVLFNQATASERAIDEVVPQVRAAVKRALALDENDVTAHAIAGRIADVYDSDFVAAAAHYQRALSLEPANPDVLYNVAVFLASIGQIDAGITVVRYLVTHDPASARVHYRLGDLLARARKFDEAIAAERVALTLSPQFSGAHNIISASLLAKGDADGALAEAQAEPSEIWRSIGSALAYHALARKADADSALSALIAKEETEASYNIAYIYAYRGEADHAFEWLDKSVGYNDGGLSVIIYEPLFDNIRSDPRWPLFLRKVGRAPEQLAKIEVKVALQQADGSTPSGPAPL